MSKFVAKNLMVVSAFASALIGFNLSNTPEANASTKRGCYVYEHNNFGGHAARFHPNGLYRQVPQRWNDRISSIEIIGPYKLIAYEHSHFRGKKRTFYGHTSYVGNRWNDRISSLVCARR